MTDQVGRWVSGSLTVAVLALLLVRPSVRRSASRSLQALLLPMRLVSRWGPALLWSAGLARAIPECLVAWPLGRR